MQQPWEGWQSDAGGGYQAVADNLARALANYALVTPVGALVRAQGQTLISAGVRYAVFNAAVLNQPVLSSVDQLNLRLQEGAQFYRKLGVPWSFWFCRNHMRLASRWMADVVLERFGLRFTAEHLGMVAAEISPVARKLPLLDVRAVGSATTKQDFAAITGEAFGLPPIASRQVYEHSGLWRGNYLGYVGYLDDRPVCTAATCTGPEGIGIYSVGTAYAYRRKGCAEAITRAVVARAQQQHAASTELPCILQSTDAGSGLYQRLGFRPVTSVAVYANI
jgi:ribosomal protein S18 acetylase RimI-like enzyme